ncbi:MAG: class I SAM-dependent methyltransferase [Candidatus Omnitrophica bacterium]|nr:class I SAM-dependent methyltransferase [Candidatus Omnitrophota bacterium]
MDKEVIGNYKTYLERKKLYKGFGYDVDKERDFILGQAKPLLGKILEAGTGKGHFALALAKQGHSFVTFDISEEEQRFAKLNLAYFGFEKQVDFRIENGEHTSFADGSFDVIFSVNVIHHLRNPYQVIEELTRLLSQEGKLVLGDFTEEGFKIMDKIHALEGKGHEVNKTTLLDIEAYLIKKGFSIKKSKSMYQHVHVAQRDIAQGL